LIKDARWSDAATLLDEILASDRDFFFRPDLRKNNWRSIKAEASQLVGTLPPAGREAYALQFRSRADRLLKQAIADNDSGGVVAVARRWFHTPAGQQATMLAAFEALESRQPLAAAAWLDRLKASSAQGFEPTLAIMRAKAWWLAGDRKTATDILEKVRGSGATTVRIGGKDVSLSFAPDTAAALLESIAGQASSALGRQDSEWWLHRGDAARNALSTATRPLLVPRYRVPLTRHPEEARLLEKRRKLFADRDMPLLPAGTPLAVDGLIVLHSPMGLLAVDFETGKRHGLEVLSILDKDAKLTALNAACADLGIGPADAVAVGDGANDLPMLMAAGLGVAFRAKPAVAATARVRVDHADLTALLYLQGFRAAEIRPDR
jgi:hypothetical protein